MKHRHMEQLGFKMKSIPYWEWDALGSESEKVEYLANLIGLGEDFELVLAGTDKEKGLRF